MLDPDALLLKDYDLKIAYLTNHLTRLWTRFNYFVGIETALFGGKLLTPNAEPHWAFPLLGLSVSLLWFVVGAQDRKLVEIYRDQINEAFRQIKNRLAKTDPWVINIPSVGTTNWQRPAVPKQASGSVEPKGLLDPMLSWRLTTISTTRLPALIPLLLVLVWTMLLLASLSTQ
jgi:hypothetical protein